MATDPEQTDQTAPPEQVTVALGGYVGGPYLPMLAVNGTVAALDLATARQVGRALLKAAERAELLSQLRAFYEDRVRLDAAEAGQIVGAVATYVQSTPPVCQARLEAWIAAMEAALERDTGAPAGPEHRPIFFNPN